MSHPAVGNHEGQGVQFRGGTKSPDETVRYFVSDGRDRIVGVESGVAVGRSHYLDRVGCEVNVVFFYGFRGNFYEDGRSGRVTYVACGGWV